MQIGFNFGARSGVEVVAPIAAGDVIVTHKHVRHVVTSVDDNIDGPVYLTVRCDNGTDCIVLAREIAYRSR